MTKYDEFRFMFGSCSSEEKLHILRPESIRLLTFIKGYSQLMVDHGTSILDSDRLEQWVAKAYNNTHELQDLIFALTTAPDEQNSRGIPELAPFSSLLNAIQHTGCEMNLPLCASLDSDFLKASNDYPLVIQNSSSPLRQVSCRLVESSYFIELYTLNESQFFYQNCKLTHKSLKDVATVFQQWLLGNYSVDDIQKA